MPNIKSSIKRVNVINKKTAENKMIKTQIKTVIKKYEAAVEANELDNAKALLNEVVAQLDSAVSKHVIHKNTASRRKARLSKLLSSKN